MVITSSILLLICPSQVAGIPVTEHLELNVVPLAVSITVRFYQTMQDFFPKAELEAVELTDADHTHLFGAGTCVQRKLYAVHCISCFKFK